MSFMNEDPVLNKLIAAFTQDGTPLPALIGNKLEGQVTILVAGLLANSNVCSELDATEIVDAAINYANVIQERLGHYQNTQINSLERLLDQ
jgi:hypothetical protein